MSQQAFGNRNDPGDTWVIARTEEGFRVYAPADPTKSYIVGGGPDDPTCTCADFQGHEGGPGWRCKHILAVLNQFARDGESDPYDAGERAAIQNETRAAEQSAPSGNDAQMLLKRSVSPDGRIDSLSVEFSCAVDGIPAGDIKARAIRTLELQAGIVQSFLASNGKENGRQPNGQPTQGPGAPNGAQSALMLSVGGINTKWGRRLYIAIQANGQTLKFFGSRKNLADALVGAGYSQLAERIDEGKALNVPCRVVTKPSEDGRYINVEQVLPAEQRAQQQRGWR